MARERFIVVPYLFFPAKAINELLKSEDDCVSENQVPPENQRLAAASMASTGRCDRDRRAIKLHLRKKLAQRLLPQGAALFCTCKYRPRDT